MYVSSLMGFLPSKLSGREGDIDAAYMASNGAIQSFVRGLTCRHDILVICKRYSIVFNMPSDMLAIVWPRCGWAEHHATRRVDLPASDDPTAFDAQDVAMCARKAQQAHASALLGPRTAVLTAMNGIPWVALR
jgi:hypothetical protein